jgi:hypothetical protein
MAITEAYSGTWTSTLTETILNTTTPETTDGIYQVFVGIDPLALGDTIEIRIKEQVLSTSPQRTLLTASVGPGNPSADDNCWVSPSLILMHGWDVTLDQIGGVVGKLLPWSIRKVA